MNSQEFTLDIFTTPFNRLLKVVRREVKESKNMLIDFSKSSSTNKNVSLVMDNGMWRQVPTTDLWFWSAEWQQGEREVDEQIRNGQVEHYKTFDDFLNSLE